MLINHKIIYLKCFKLQQGFSFPKFNLRRIFIQTIILFKCHFHLHPDFQQLAANESACMTFGIFPSGFDLQLGLSRSIALLSIGPK